LTYSCQIICGNINKDIELNLPKREKSCHKVRRGSLYTFNAYGAHSANAKQEKAMAKAK